MAWVKSNNTLVKADDDFCATVQKTCDGRWHYSLTFAGDVKSKIEAKRVVDEILNILQVSYIEEAEAWKQG